MKTHPANAGRATRSLFKWLLIVLIAANVGVWTAWPFRAELVARGILAPPPVERVDLDPEALPPIVDRTDADQAVDPRASDAPEESAIDGVEPTDPDADLPSAASDGVTVETPLTEPATLSALLACVVAGPIARDAAEALATRLGSTGALVDAPEEAGVGLTGYLVYVEPAASRDAAWLVLRELEARSIRDADVIRSGPYENAVAVGVYSVHNRSFADARRDQIAALGYDVIVRERQGATYRLRARQVPADALGDLPYGPCQRKVIESQPQTDTDPSHVDS